jgi:phosphatidylglycerophosphatase A
VQPLDLMSPKDAPTPPSRRAPTTLSLLIATGFGSGLSPWAPGTVGTLWAWASFALFDIWLGDMGWALLLAIGGLVGWWAATFAVRQLRSSDPRRVVCDEILAFWLVLWMISPAGFGGQLAAFVLFRFFDAVKPGPVGWADRVFHSPGAGRQLGWRQGLGILFDDLVAAGCTLFVYALGVWAWARF